MSGRFRIAELRGRCNQDFDGEAHLTTEELEALLDVVDAAQDVACGLPGVQNLRRRLTKFDFGDAA